MGLKMAETGSELARELCGQGATWLATERGRKWRECNWNEGNQPRTDWELGELLRGTALRLEIGYDYWQTNPKYYLLGPCVDTTLNSNPTKFQGTPISRSAVVARSLCFALGPGDAARDIGRRSNLQGRLACTRLNWGSCLFEAEFPTRAVGALNLLINVLSDCWGSRDHSAPICWGPVIPPMLDISTEFGANPSSRRGWAVAVCWELDGLCGWGGAEPRALPCHRPVGLALRCVGLWALSRPSAHIHACCHACGASTGCQKLEACLRQSPRDKVVHCGVLAHRPVTHQKTPYTVV